MIYLLYAHFQQPLRETDFDQYLSRLPFTMQQRVRQYRKREDAQASLLGKILLQEGASRFFQWDNMLQNIYYTDWNRPFAISPLSFNISHSHQIVVCVLSEHYQLGVDVEKLAPIGLDLYREQMSDREWVNIYGSADPMQLFYQYWTQKEAALKADGRGLGIPMKEVEVLSSAKVRVQSQEWQLQTVDTEPGYICQLATKTPVRPEQIRTYQWISDGCQAFQRIG